MRCTLFIAAMVLGLRAAAQFSVEPGTTLLVDPGTSLRLESSGAFAIPTGSTVINNGEVVLGPGTDLQEAAGAAISGTGVERTTRDLGAVTQADIGGLGAKLTTTASLGLTQITRGHMPFTDYSGSTSIARWVQVDPANNTGLNAGLEFRYDLNELNAVPQSDQVVHIRHQPDVWWALPGAVNVPTGGWSHRDWTALGSSAPSPASCRTRWPKRRGMTCASPWTMPVMPGSTFPGACPCGRSSCSAPAAD